MNFEIIRKNNKKKIIIGGLIVLSLVSALTFVTTRSKYKETKSIKIARGTVRIDNADLKVIAVKLSEDGTNYTDTNEVPTSGYTLNTGMSKCFVNGTEDTTITVTYKNGGVTFLNLKKGAKCNLYFDKKTTITVNDIISNSNYKTTAPTFTSVATGNEGVYATSDGMYGETTYYWRGATTNNYVQFAGFCWRIVRINGDGSIRIIYDGTTCHANGTKTVESIALTEVAYNSNPDNSSYVGWSYTKGSQRPNNTSPQKSGARAPIRVTLEDTWYDTNITKKGYDGKIATGKFCNDRNTGQPASNWNWSSGTYNTTWGATGTQFAYAPAGRLGNETMTPTTSCPNGDVYELKIGLITADELQFAGASWTIANKKYYLYNGQYYWTMSPASWNRSALVFIVDNTNGYPSYNPVDNTAPGIRPVINLRSDTLFKTGGNGTQNNPYVVQ